MNHSPKSQNRLSPSGARTISAACLSAPLQRLLAVLFLCSGLLSAPARAEDNIFLYTTFDADGQNGVFAAYSEDGRNFVFLNGGKAILTPPAAVGPLMRDPSLIYRDGQFRMVWTGDWGGNYFGYASSTDLKTWNPAKVTPFVGEQPNPNTWAPEVFYDPVAANYKIVFSATLHSEWADGDGSAVGSYDNRLYCTTTTDFSTFTPASLFYDINQDVIDGMLAYDEPTRRWIMVNAASGVVKLTTHDAVLNGFAGWSPEVKLVGGGLNLNGGKRGEGPTILKHGSEWLLYWDCTWDNDWGMASSADLSTWTNLTSQFHLYNPNGTEYVHPRHGTISVVPRSALSAFPEVPPSPLRAHLLFNEPIGATTAADASGHGWNGTFGNNPKMASGKGGNALSLTGSAYVSMPSGVVSDLFSFTISAWVNLNSVSNWARLFDFGTSTSNYMFLSPKSSDGTLRFAITTSGLSGEQRINASGALSSGSWTHVAVTMEGETGILYVNGAEVGRNQSMTLKPKNLGTTTQNYIGRSQFSDPYLDGLVDDFRIYSTALSASEIQALANGTAGALLSPWTSQDIGSPALAGSAGSGDSGAGSALLTASGNDIWDVADQFHYAWKSWSGDGALIARVSSLRNTDGWAKAGIMFRDSLSANAANCLVAITATNGCSFQYRAATGATCSFSANSGVAAPQWVKLVRSGNLFTPWHSTDGLTWTQTAPAVTLPLSSTAYVGLALTSHTNGALAASQFDNLQFIDPAMAGPGSVVATSGSGQITLSWQALNGANSYKIKRATTSGGPYTTISSGITATSYTDSGLSEGATFYYVLSAISGITESSDSAEISGTSYTAIQNWRLQSFGSAANAGRSADSADPDGDGWTNAQEFLSGTDPNSSQSALAVNKMEVNGSDVVVRFPTVSGKTYRLECSNDLAPGSWSTVQDNISGTGGDVLVTDSGAATQSRRFYRIVVQ